MAKATSTRHSSIFIVSSEEALPVARAVKDHFDKEAHVDIWNENIYKVNRGYLETLLNRAVYYDFLIAVFSADDVAKIRKKTVKVPRDNVIFEFGLFLGRLGPHRTFLILQEGVELFNDLSGIVQASFSPRENLVAAVGAACHKFREAMAATNNQTQFAMLPSTSLAIGYYQNFVKRVLEAFDETEEFSLMEKDSKGAISRESRLKVAERLPLLHVMVPSRLRDLEPDRRKGLTAKFTLTEVITPKDKFHCYIKGDVDGGNRIVLFDIAATMWASRIAIERSFRDDFLARDDTEQHLEGREIANFERTLRILVPENLRSKRYKFSVLK